VHDFLVEMKVRQERRVAAARAERPEVDLRSRVTGSTRSLNDALQREGARFVFECKAASPSEGVMLAEYDPAALARAYEGAADALSVLTEPDFFSGSLEHLTRVREVSPLPILRKDFIVDPYQVLEARAFGADAVLLIAALLDDRALDACVREARRLDLDVLLEVHDEADMERALTSDVRLIGINNRDLSTLGVDVNAAPRLASRVGADRTVVAESGYGDPDRVRAHAAEVDAFLIGTSVVKAPDPGAEARRLVFGRVKICGLTRAEDAERAAELGATHLGFIRWPGSKRYVDDLSPFLDGVRPRVGVYVDPSAVELAEDARRYGLGAVQVHGKMPADPIELPSGCELWRAVTAQTRATATRADRLVFDAERIGGSGQTFDWDRIPVADRPRSWLAGGITPDNASRAREVGAYGLDLSSGVEVAPGIKSPERMAELFSALRPRSRTERRIS
jgi:indole-3-glycerol phosphate synthase/phosphoribosylanthranilate isomerase